MNSAKISVGRDIGIVSLMTEKIHSGQFMISKYDEESDTEDLKEYNKAKGYNFEPDLFTKNFTFSDGTEEMLEIDGSLQKMFQFLSLTMAGKITNPKWNSFKGVKFHTKDKIRLNNIIWREYHMQFVKKLKPVVVQFASPLTETPQILGTVVLEGKYWKRKNNIIVHQYKKWREFSKHKFLINPNNGNCAALFKSIHVQRNGHYKFTSSSPPPNLNDIFMDLDDLDLPYCDMSEDELTSEIMQPQLTNLQPRMDSSIDFLNDFLCSPQKSFKSQKLFSSETCLNFYEAATTAPSTKIGGGAPQCSTFDNNNLSNYFHCPPPPPATSISEMVPISLFDNSHHLPISEPASGHDQYPHHSFQSDIKPGPNELGLCKTPNLLSILLQPISSSAMGHRPDKQHLLCASVSPLQNNLVISSVLNYSGSHVRAHNATSSMKTANNLQPIHKTNVAGTCHDKSIGYQACNHQSVATGRFRKSKSPSLFNQSMKMRHNLSANNVVQQYLDELNSILVTNKDQNKISKAALLHKASEHIKRLRNDKYHIQSEIASLQNEIDALQNRFSVFCSQLPATGVCLNSNRGSEGRKWFDDFVLKSSSSNWKFYIFCMMFDNLFTSYNNSVSTLSMEALAHNVASWLEKECSLMKLRLIVINGMRTLSRKTSIVNNPKKMIDEVKVLACNSYSQQNAASAFASTTDSFKRRTSPDKQQQPQPFPTRDQPDPASFKHTKIYQTVDAGWPQMLVQHGRPSNNPDNTEI